MRKNPLPSYQPAFTAPRSVVGRVLMDACLNCSRPLAYDVVSFVVPLFVLAVLRAYCVTERKDGMGYCRREKKWVFCCGHSQYW